MSKSIHILDENKIASNYDKFRDVINTSFANDPRLFDLNEMYDKFDDRLPMCPASSRVMYHNAFAGGYIDHVLRVHENALKIYDLYKDSGMDLTGFTKSELEFAAIHHDLGKLGNDKHPLYIKNPSSWHVKNQGKIYVLNPELHYMNMNDRTVWLLNHFGIKFSEVELIGIRLADGLYDEANKEYYISYSEDTSLKISLPYILHSADIMAVNFERERLNKLYQPTKKSTGNNQGGRPKKKPDAMDEFDVELSGLFSDINSGIEEEDD